MTHKTQRARQTEVHTDQRGFGYFDAAGRTIGLMVKTFETTYEDVRDDREFGFDSRKAGVYFECFAYATRDMEVFGKVHSMRYFETREARAAFIAKLWESSAKAAAKKAA